MAHDFDVIVIGSGFGGSVSALRLAEKGYRVAVIEAGRRFADDELPETSWRLRRYLFAPALGCYGILRVSLLDNVVVMSGAGVGGGSLGYANTLYEPTSRFYDDPRWSGITDWRGELAGPFDQAKRMLGVSLNPRLTPSDEAMRAAAESLGAGATFTRTPVGVHFGRPGDPYFGGAGPHRTGCTFCGSCMTGCRVGAKNTLVKNYLYLAERAGVTVLPMTTVTDLRRRAGGWDVRTRRTGGMKKGELHAAQVIVAAGAMGTQRLLHRLRDRGRLPGVSPRLGELSRTNSESILGARTRRRPGTDFSRGVAITSSVHLGDTHVEPVRYGRGSNLLALMGAALVDDPGGRSRLHAGLRELVRLRGDARLLLSPRRWSEQTVVLLGMQARDNSITLYSRRGLLGRRLRSRQGVGEPNPVWQPAAHEMARRVAAELDGVPIGALSELVNRPVTGHFLGGCAIGTDAASGVVDPYHRVHGCPGLHVIDGSTVAANLGVNPSLTITAMAERALAMWPNAGEPDPRPSLGEPYRRVAAVAPHHPAVPAGAPGELRVGLAAPPR